MVIRNKFKDNASTPRDRRLLLITQRTSACEQTRLALIVQTLV
jgi:hypothetical protein